MLSLTAMLMRRAMISPCDHGGWCWPCGGCDL